MRTTCFERQIATRNIASAPHTTRTSSKRFPSKIDGAPDRVHERRAHRSHRPEPIGRVERRRLGNHIAHRLGNPIRTEAAFFQYRINAIALIARKAFKMLLEGFIHNDDDGSRCAGPPIPACCERDRKPDAS